MLLIYKSERLKNKKKFVSIIIVAFLILVVLRAVPVCANLANPNKPTRGVGVEDRIVDANIAPATVRPGGAITATGYVQWYCSATCNPPEAARLRYRSSSYPTYKRSGVHKGKLYNRSKRSLRTLCQAPTTPGTYQYEIVVPAQCLDAGTYIGPWPITVS